MNLRQNAAMKPSGYAIASAVSDAKTEQRAINVRAFQEKYDAMLYLVEFIASLQLVGLIGTKNPQQAKKMEELKSVVAQARNGLGICQSKISPFDGSTRQGKVESREY